MCRRSGRTHKYFIAFGDCRFATPCLVLQVMCNSGTHTHTYTHALAISWFGVSSSCISTTTMCHTDIIIMTWASFTVREESAALPQNHKLHTRTHTQMYICAYIKFAFPQVALPCLAPGPAPTPAPAAPSTAQHSRNSSLRRQLPPVF